MSCDTVTPRTICAPAVSVGPSPGRGRGVFATRQFAPGEMIEMCLVVALSEADARKLDATGLYDYYFGWAEDGRQAAIALGYGSIYNHSSTPNAQHHKNFAANTMSVIALRPIAAGEEIFIRYETGKGEVQPAVWFEVR
ncbi:MAG TPA: SET domain-containing protein [Acetobacteraceae bacterium]|nr:SET domain-containing protein [Acetobacteraceae bacterium]